MKKRLYSIKELAKEIGGTEWYWRTLIWKGKLPFVQTGRKMLVDSRDVETFIQNNKTCNYDFSCR
jgi:excisionase family DNA binding protein